MLPDELWAVKLSMRGAIRAPTTRRHDMYPSIIPVNRTTMYGVLGNSIVYLDHRSCAWGSVAIVRGLSPVARVAGSKETPTTPRLRCENSRARRSTSL